MKPPIVEFDKFDPEKVLFDRDVVEQHNPHRFELSLLDGILFIDEKRAVAYRDVKADDFWVRGHFPQRPVMPGVLVCETAAQLTAFFGSHHNYRGEGIMGLGGLENVRFRSSVEPGDKLIVMLELNRHRRGVMITTDFQAYVGERLCAEGLIKGIMIPGE